MAIDSRQISSCLEQSKQYLTKELLPFWLDRCKDNKFGGFLTHFDKDGKAGEETEKSLIAQTRTVFTMASAHRAGYGGGRCSEYAKFGVDFLIDKMWDDKFGGFYWMVDRQGNVTEDKKIIYGHSFAIYSLSEYTLATGDSRGIEYAEKVFDLLQKYCADTMYGGYFEMFERNWDICGPDSAGGDRKTLDVHMHLMEAFTTLFQCSSEPIHKRKLLEDIDILLKRMMHPEFKTGIPQFTIDWQVASQIKFDIVWGWDRYTESGEKENAGDNTCYGHNIEFAWLFIHAFEVMGISIEKYKPMLETIIEHTVNNGIDKEFGGVFIEGPHAGGVYDMEKEFWQQAEALIGLLDACLYFDAEKYWPYYQNVHNFVFNKGINHEAGEWWPLLSRQGKPIWTHMSHNWKVNYHSVRAMVQSIHRLEKLFRKFDS